MCRCYYDPVDAMEPVQSSLRFGPPVNGPESVASAPSLIHTSPSSRHGDGDPERSPLPRPPQSGPVGPSDVSGGMADRSASSQKRRPSRAATTYPRKRATHACVTCRFRRTKCDNVRPACASCVRLGADCRYQEMDPSR